MSEPNLFLEPWGLTPADLAELTDDQIERLYRRPAVERAKRIEREVKPGADQTPLTLDELRPDRETFVAMMLDEFGGDRAKWESDWERLKKSWEAP